MECKEVIGDSQHDFTKGNPCLWQRYSIGGSGTSDSHHHLHLSKVLSLSHTASLALKGTEEGWPLGHGWLKDGHRAVVSVSVCRWRAGLVLRGCSWDWLCCDVGSGTEQPLQGHWRKGCHPLTGLITDPVLMQYLGDSNELYKLIAIQDQCGFRCTSQCELVSVFAIQECTLESGIWVCWEIETCTQRPNTTV